MSQTASKVEAGTPPLVSDTSAEATGTDVGEMIEGEGLEEEQEPLAPSFPPYPPYMTEPAPICVADHVDHGNEMRREYKSKPPQRVKPYPRMAKPWGCKAGSAPMTRRQLLAHLRCLKRHGVVLTDRLTQIAKPSRRTVLSKWRENALILAPEIIVRYRTMLDADDPWSPDQAYQFFLNMRKSRRKTPCQQKKLTKREMQAICGDKRFTWARNATVAFARGIQERLCKPGCFTLNGGMLRLSDIILEELCGYMSVRVPARCSNNRKARFMMEMSDKIAIWIDDILAESDDRMLMMDFDEDDEVAMTMSYPPSELIADICNVPSADYCDACDCSASRPSSDLVAKPCSSGKPSSSKCDMCDCSTKSTSKTSKGQNALSAGAMPSATSEQNVAAPIPSSGVASAPIAASTTEPTAGSATAPTTGSAAETFPTNPSTTNMVGFLTSDSSGGGDFADSFLNMMGDSFGEKPAYTKFPGDMLEAFKMLNRAMDKKGDATFLVHGKFTQTYKEAAVVLRQARDFHATEFDCTLAQILNCDLASCVAKDTPKNVKPAMKEMVDICSKYLAQNAEFHKDKGEAFQLLLEAMYSKGPCLLYSQGQSRRTYAQAADDLVNAKSLETDYDDPTLTQYINAELSTLVQSKSPDYLINDMIETLDICSRYLSKKAVDEDERGPAFDHLIKILEKNGNKPFTPEYPPLALQFAAAYVLKSAPSLLPREPVPDTAMTPVSLHSMERPKTPPQEARSGSRLEPTGSGKAVPIQTSVQEPQNQPSMNTVPVQTSKHPLQPGAVTSLRSTKSPMAATGATGSLKTMLSPAPDGGGSLKTMVSPQEMGQTSNVHLSPRPPSIVRSKSQQEAPPPVVGSLRSTKSQPEPVGSVKSAKGSAPDGAAIKSSHLIATMGPVPESAEIFNEALHQAVDSETSSSMANEMNEVVDRCSGYLAAFVRDRDLTLMLLLEMMYGKNAVVLVERKRNKMTYGDAANKIQQAPFLIPFLPVKDIAVEIKNKLTEDMKELTPYELKVSMQCAIKDAAGFLSQVVALKSGAAGERYNLEFLTAIKHSLGARPLYKYKSYGHTYAEGAKTLKFAGPLERGDTAPDLQAEIKEEIHLAMPMRVAPTVVEDLKDTIHDASRHLAQVGKHKGLAMQHLVSTMREKGAGDFAVIQGLPETYESGARAIEVSPTLHNDSVDRPTYDAVRQKLTQLTKDNPHPDLDKQMPAIVDEASRFLAKPVPQTHADKRAMLARLLAMKGNTVLAHDGLYKMTYKNASEDLANAKFGQTTAVNERLREQILNLMINAIPDQKTLVLLQDAILEGSAHLADTISGRAAALKVIHDALMLQEDIPFLTVGNFMKTHREVAELIKNAPYLMDRPNPTLYGIVSEKIKNLPKGKVGMLAEAYMGDASDKVSKHISRTAADEAGMSSSQLAAWSASGGESKKSLSGLFLKCPLTKEGSFLSKVGSAFGVRKEPSEGKGGGSGGPQGGPGGPGGGSGGAGGAGGAGSGAAPGGGPGSPGAQGGAAGSPRAQGGPGSPAARGASGGPGSPGIPGSPGGPASAEAALAEGPGSAGGQGTPGSGIGAPGTGIGGPGSGVKGPGSGIGALGTGIGGPGSGVGVPGSDVGGRGSGVAAPGSGIGRGLGSGVGVPGSGVGHPGSGVAAPGSGIGRGLGSGVGVPGSGVGHPGSGVAAPGSGIGSLGGGVEAPGSGIGAPGSGIQPPGSGIGAPGSGVGAGPSGSGIGTPGSGIGPPRSGIGAPGSGVESPGRGIRAPGSGVLAPGSGVGSPGSGVGAPGSGVVAPESGVGAPGSGIGAPGSGIRPPGSGIRATELGEESLVGRDGSAAGGEGRMGRDVSGTGQPPPRSAGDLSRAKSKSRSKESILKESSGRWASLSDEELEENERALKILLRRLNSKGGEIFYKQPLTTLTHSQAADWLKMDPPMHIDKSVKHSSDTARLTKKFEKKLGYLVCAPGSTTESDKEPMQDVIIESARILSEYFVSTNYKILARDALISEMQNKGNEILIEVDGAAETFFFAAQRLKKTGSIEVLEPCNKVSYYISKKLDEMVRCRTMPRKLAGTLKEHAKEASEYLSTLVTKPDIWIEAYVSILDEMENTGSKLLFRGEIPKSYKDSAAYLRGLPSYEDRLKRGDLFLNSAIPLKLMMMMRDVAKKNDSVCNVITIVSKLLVSYIKLQQEQTEVLKFIVKLMDKAKCGIILNHGKLRKTYQEAANLLRKKNADQINQIDQYVDPVVARKVQIKMYNLVKDVTIPPALQEHMEDTLEKTTNYLAVELLEAHTIRVCKCMNSVFIQCELWCDEILRKITRPICSCARHAAAQMTECHGQGRSRPQPPSPIGRARPLTPDPCPLTIKECPAKKCSEGYDEENPCPASLNLPTYLMYSSSYDNLRTLGTVQPLLEARRDESDVTPYASEESLPGDVAGIASPLAPKSVICARLEAEQGPHASWSTPKVLTSDSSFHSARTSHGPSSAMPIFDANTLDAAPTASAVSGSYPTASCPVSGVVSTDQMADWHALMVSFVWNIQAWRDWLQETLDRGLHYRSMPPAKAEEHWLAFHKRVTTETVQWRHYNAFSRELLVRIALRYNDKVIVSPTRFSEKTKEFLACQDEMLQIIEIFNRWTKWLAKMVAETDALKILPSDHESISERRWKYYKEKVEECSKEWLKYNEHLQLCWEDKYWASIAEWLPPRHQAGPVWVVSACGAVPSGAVAAGVHGGAVCWLARAAHRRRVLPAALLPARHCCWLYADGAVHCHTKYQVMCNAEVSWVPWRAGSMRAAAVRVAPDVYVGRVLYRGNHLVGAVQAPTYRCHVVIFNRPFAFSCYELLILATASSFKSRSGSASKSA